MARINSGSYSSALAFIVIMGAVCLLNYQRVQSTPVAGQQQSGNNDDSIVVFPQGVDCKPDERVVQGLLPRCEPSCEDPRPICNRVFVMDSVLCFCKEPLVRNTQTKQCVKLEDCPTLKNLGQQ